MCEGGPVFSFVKKKRKTQWSRSTCGGMPFISRKRERVKGTQHTLLGVYGYLVLFFSSLKKRRKTRNPGGPRIPYGKISL